MKISKTIVILCVVAIAAAAIPAHAGSCIVLTPTSCVAGVCNAAFQNTDPSSAAYWALVAVNNASCAPSGSGTVPPSSQPPNTLAVMGQATAGATSPLCSWTCIGYSNPATPAVISFDAADGLPVELMGFSVE